MRKEQLIHFDVSLSETFKEISPNIEKYVYARSEHSNYKKWYIFRRKATLIHYK